LAAQWHQIVDLNDHFLQVLSWIDICAGLAAKSVAGGPCVTASVDAVHFLRPVRTGSVAIIAAMVNRTFKSSMEVLDPGLKPNPTS